MDSHISVHHSLRRSKSLSYLFRQNKIVGKAKKITCCFRKDTKKKGCTLNSCNEKAFRERFRVYHNNNMMNTLPSKANILTGKRYSSCGNLPSNTVKPMSSSVKMNSQIYSENSSSSRRASAMMMMMKCTKEQRSNKNNNNNNSEATTMIRPRSLRQLHDDLLPLLEAASSLSSIGSYGELTEESFLESSFSDDSNKNVLVRRGAKLRNIKHRPHSFALCEHNLMIIPENTIENNNMKKRLYLQSLSNIHKSDQSGGKLIDIDDDVSLEKDIINHNNNNINNNNGSNENNENSNEKNILNTNNDKNLQKIALPRRRCRSAMSSCQTTPVHNNNKHFNDESPTSCCELSFSKEQIKKLKQKMRDTKKSPEKSVFLGLF